MAMTEISLRQPLRYTIDLSAGLVQQPMRSQLMKGDKKANRVIVHLTDGGKDVTLSGVTVTGSFIRPPDAAEIPLTGETSGSEAIVTLDDACYSTEGYCEISVKLTVGETSRTILTLTGYVLSKGSGAYVDVSGVIPNIDDVIAQYAEMKRVTQETQAAGTAAGNAAGAANTAADEANRQAQAAQQAAQAANTAAAKIDGLTVSAEKANEAEAEVSQKDGAYHVNFKLPKGDTGATPDITFEVATGAAGSDVQIEQSGTPEAPVVKLTIPRGDTGAVEGIDYYEGNPEALGEASPGTANGVARGDHVHPKPTPEELGAATIDDITPGAKTTYSSEKIEGELSSLSQQIADVGTPNLLVNSNFQKPYLINLNAASGSYEAWSGEIFTGWFNGGKQSTFTPGENGTTVSGQFYQNLKKPNEYVGKTYTLGAKVDGRVYCVSGEVQIPGTWHRVAYLDTDFGYIEISAQNDGELWVLIDCSDITSLVEWAALVPGTYTAETFPEPIWLHPRLEMIRMGLPTQPVNLLDNSDFTNPVNQRGLTSYSDTSGEHYTIDRWFALNNTNVHVRDGCVEISPIASSGRGFRQRINYAYKLAGKTVTLAVSIKSIAEKATLYIIVDGTQTNFEILKAGVYIMTLTLPETIEMMSVGLGMSGADDTKRVAVQWAALYEGAYTAETLPPYRQKEYAVELAECRRYYRVYKSVYIKPAILESKNKRHYRFEFDSPMWSAPDPVFITLAEKSMWSEVTRVFNAYSSDEYGVTFASETILSDSDDGTNVYCNGDIAFDSDL